MRRRGKAAKTRRRKSLTLKQRNASKALRQHNLSPAHEEENVPRLSRELSEAFERQAATAEILSIISNSPTDTQPVFNSIVQSGLKLFPDALISIALREGDAVKPKAIAEPDPARVEAWRRSISRTPLTRQYMHGSAILDRRVVDIPDVRGAPAEFAVGAQNFLTSGYRAITIMPLMRRDEAIGALSVVRLAPGPLSDKQLALLRTFAAQAVIAIENTRLLNELRQRTSDLAESLEQQTATAEILSVISNSLTDTQPVFDAIVKSAVALFPDALTSIALKDGDMIRGAAAVAVSDPVRVEAWRRTFPYPLTRKYMHGRAILDCRVVDVPDVEQAPAELAVGARNFLSSGYRAITIMPMIRGDAAIGALSVVRLAPGPLSDKQVAVLRTFAAQAVIAIENTRLLSELRESLQQQTATADVLKVISRSTFDLDAVLQTLVEAAARLCNADKAQILRPSAAEYSFYAAANYGHTTEYNEYLRTLTFTPGREGVVGRVLLERKPVQIADVLADPDYRLLETQRLGGFRTHLGIPLLREGKPIGILVVSQSPLVHLMTSRSNF